MYTVMFDQVCTFLHLFLSLVDLTGLLEDEPVSHLTQRQHTAALHRGIQHHTQHTWGGGGWGEEERRGRGRGG